MTRTTAMLVSTFAIALASVLAALPASAQRVFVSGSGSDSNPCTFAQPCRTFQQAYNTAPVNGEIDVLDPAGYGALNITHSISVQAHGFGGVTETNSNGEAIFINAGDTDNISLNGLLLDGAGSGGFGIYIQGAASVQIVNCVVRHFSQNGIGFYSGYNPTSLSVLDTVVSDNSNIGIDIQPENNIAYTPVTLSRVTANRNSVGVAATVGYVMIANSDLSDNVNGLAASSTVWLGKTVLSGNTGAGVVVDASATVHSYGNNDIGGNADSVSGSLTTTSTE